MISINDVKGIGPRNSMLFEKIDIRTVDDLVSHYPYRYDLIKRTNLQEAQEMDKVIVDGKIVVRNKELVSGDFSKIRKDLLLL